MIKIFIVRGLLFMVLISLFPHIPTALAVDSTSSSSPSAEVKTKLQMLQEDIASRAANFKTEINKKLFNKAYIGFLTNKTGSSLMVLVKNLPKTIKINQDTVFVIKNKIVPQDSALTMISQNDSLASLGDIDDNGILIAKKIIKLPEDNAPLKKVVYGNPVSIQNGVINLKNNQNEEFNISLDKKAEIFLGKDRGSFSDIKLNRQIIAVMIPIKDTLTNTSTSSAEKSKLTSYSAQYVYIIPASLSLKPKITTPSATITPSGIKKSI